MNDEELLATVRGSLTRMRDSLGDVHMERAAGELIARARARRRRMLSAGAAATAVLAAVAVLLAGVLPASGQTPGGAARARLVAYVLTRVRDALAHQNLVLSGRTSGTFGNTPAWVYGRQGQFEEFWPSADYRDRIVHGRRLWDFPPKDRGKPFLAEGTAMVHGKLKDAYVTYWDRRYSLSKVYYPPNNACSKDAALSMGAPPSPGVRWPSFVSATIACGAASVTGHVLIDGVETIRITGKAVTVRMPGGEARAVGEKWARGQWTMYVYPRTYLPVRITSVLRTFGGPRRATTAYSTLDITWLPPTPANIAKTLVTIPPGFHRWHGNPGNQ